MDPSPYYPSYHGMPPETEYYGAQYSTKGPYKERFHATRERYALASQTQEDFKKELEACLAKEKALQEEVNLLIDVLGVALSDQPTVREFMAVTPPPPPSRALASRYSSSQPKVEDRVATIPQNEPLPQSSHNKEAQFQTMDDPMEN